MSNISPNNIRIQAVEIVNDVFLIGSKYVRHQKIFAFFQYFFKPRLDRIILQEASVDDIKSVLWAIKQKIDPMFKNMDTVEQLKDTKLNDPDMIKKLMKLPQFEKLAEMLD